MIKIFVNTPYSSDANSFWRCMGPLSYLAKQSRGEIQIHLPVNGTQINWDRLMEYDLIFMHRPCSSQDIILLQMARLLNIPVWSDFDDWLFHLPSWNPHCSIYHNLNRQQQLATMIACSDVVTVSTEALAEKFKGLNPNVVILPNAYRSDLYPFREEALPERKRIFTWRGTNTHEGDLYSVAEAFPKLSEKVHFLGGPPYSVLSRMDPEKYQKMDFVDPMIYWKSIHQLAPKVWLFPLKDDFFNHCKSNISYLEANHAGAVCVAPDLPEWRHPGVVTYKIDDADSFLEAAEFAMALEEESFNTMIEEGRQEILSRYDISVVNVIREALVQALLKRDFKRNGKDPFNPMTGMWALGVLKGEISSDSSQEERVQ